ncbi:MAG: hypothetical protein M3N31_07325 [Actinomycetota bacterium]|nr:hypothetical protein [Actinomycetota bacterium]
MDDTEEIRHRLEGIAEELADLALARLHQAVEVGEADPAEERRITRARRAVEKAAQLLRPPTADG